MKRKVTLATGEIYHIFNKSIYNFVIFTTKNEFSRMRNLIKYYQIEKPDLKFYRFMELKVRDRDFDETFAECFEGKERIVQVIAYCIMPTHLHLILKQLKENGISIFMGNILNSYSRFFNTLHKRKGPLWESRFKNVLVESDEQLLHLSRYIHLNPTSAGLVEKSEKWLYSSYLEYLGKIKNIKRVCYYEDTMEVRSSSYRKFVEDRVSYQKELERIKHLVLEEISPYTTPGVDMRLLRK